MGNDFWIVLQWWGTLFLVGAVAFPLTKYIFSSWYDKGYLFSKAVGMAVVSYAVYLLGSTRIAAFSASTVFWMLVLVFLGGVALQFRSRPVKNEKERKRSYLRTGILLGVEELFFFIALLAWAWVKGHEGSIRGLEKFMDYGFMQSILHSTYFPAADMWYAGFPINYYYFGHTVVAVLTKLSGIDLSYTFNLMLATLFACTLTSSFSLGYQLLRHHVRRWGAIAGGLLTAFLVTLAGNMQTLYAFTQGYTGEDVQPFWELWWPLADLAAKLPEGIQRYWYANATRFIPFTIHEFPSYSFVVSDIHGHVLSLPFVLLAIGLLFVLFGSAEVKRYWFTLGFYGFLVSILLMTNALDGPIYMGLFVVLFLFFHRHYLIHWRKEWRKIVSGIGLVGLVALLTSVPFLSHFNSFVSGLAVNCPPLLLANRTIGPLLFEGVEKCQHSPFWMMALLWGFFWFCGGAFLFWKWKGVAHLKEVSLAWNTKFTQFEQVLVILFFFSLALLIFPEFFYFKDIYPAHFRSNTMFKLGYEAFIFFSLIAGYTIVQGCIHKKKLFLWLLVPQLFLVSIYPAFSVRSYFDSLRVYKGLDGLTWIEEQYPDDYAAISWLKQQPIDASDVRSQKTIVEADGDSYTDYARFSAFTGRPTIIGWPVHEWLWRGSYDVVAPRREQVRIIYESSDIQEVQQLLSLYTVQYVIVGTLEREKFVGLDEEKFGQLGRVVFSSGSTTIYEIGETAL